MKKGMMNVNTIILIILAIFIFTKFNQPIATTQAQPELQQEPISDTSCKISENTITFNGVDLYNLGTQVPQGHLLVSTNGAIVNIQLANSATKILKPGTKYKALLGNLTSFNGTNYYPQYIEGEVKCEGTETLQGKLPKATTATDMAFSFRNSAESFNTAQALGNSETASVRIRFAPSLNTCFGNPYAAEKGGKNVMCFTYNSSAYNYVELYGEEVASIPKSTRQNNSFRAVGCYTFPVICNAEEYQGKLVIQTSATGPTSAGGANISISLHDVTFDINTETSELIIGVEDEPKTRNDIGVIDFNQGGDYLYSISVS